MHTYQHLLPAMGAAAANQFADLIDGCRQIIHRLEPANTAIAATTEKRTPRPDNKKGPETLCFRTF